MRILHFFLLIFFFSYSTVLFSASDNKSSSRFEYLELFNKVLYMIENQYYRDVNMKKLIHGAIKGMIDTLDPHSAFLDETLFKKMQDDANGEFGGLGMEVTQKDGIIYIKTVFVDTPAFRHGLKSGDKIVEVEHESTVGYSLDEVVDKMKGKNNTPIHLGIVRDGVTGIKYYNIQREIIKLRPGKYELIKNNFAFIRLYQFQKGAGDFVRSSLVKLSKESIRKGGLKGIILDLRSNPGGLLDEAVEVSSVFLKEGTVVSTEGRSLVKKDVRSVVNKGYKDLKTPLVLIINASSASASEIVAGALQDYKRAVILGQRSFGKGSVQSVIKIDDDTGVKMTIAQYMTPQKRKIQALGIIPDIELNEWDAEWTQNNKFLGSQIREIDLKNHLSATIETEEEKKLRLKEEKSKREKRLKLIEMRKKSENENEKEILFEEYDPHNDFQVLEAINYLKSFDVYKTFIKNEG